MSIPAQIVCEQIRTAHGIVFETRTFNTPLELHEWLAQLVDFGITIKSVDSAPASSHTRITPDLTNNPLYNAIKLTDNDAWHISVNLHISDYFLTHDLTRHQVLTNTITKFARHILAILNLSDANEELIEALSGEEVRISQAMALLLETTADNPAYKAALIAWVENGEPAEALAKRLLDPMIRPELLHTPITLTLTMIDRDSGEVFDTQTFPTYDDLKAFLTEDLAEGELTVKSVTPFNRGVRIQFDSSEPGTLDYTITNLTVDEYNQLFVAPIA